MDSLLDLDIRDPSLRPSRKPRTNKSRVTIGIDPGLNGAIAVLDEQGHVLAAQVLPTLGKGTNRIPDGHRIWKWLQHAHKDSIVILEKVWSQPKEGPTGAFRFGTAYGYLKALVDLSELKCINPAATTWKRKMKLYGQDKENIRQLAIAQHPEAREVLKHKKNHNTAEAIFLAEYGRMSK